MHSNTKTRKWLKVMTYIAKPSLAEVTRRMNQRYQLTVWWSDGSLTTVKDLPLESAHRRQELFDRRDDVVRMCIEPLLRQGSTSSGVATSLGLGRVDRSA